MPLVIGMAALRRGRRGSKRALTAAGAILLVGVLSVPATISAATPPPLVRPFPAPIVTHTVTVPGTIDATGERDSSRALQAFLKTVPDGSRILFRADGVYRLDRGLLVANRHRLVFDGRGATLRALGPGDLNRSSAFLLDGANSDIAIQRFRIVGSNTRTGADLFVPGLEGQQGIAVYGGARIEISSNTIIGTEADGVYANENDLPNGWVDGLWIHDNNLSRIGRMGITLNGVSNGTVERNKFDQIGMFVFDIEPNDSTQGARNVAYLNNTVGTYGWTPRYTNWFFAAANNSVAPGAVIENVTVSGNVVTGGAPSSGNTPNAGGLATWIGRSRVKNVTFTNNQSTKLGRGPVLVFEHVDGLHVAGNVQPVLGGVLTRISDSTGVTAQDHDPVSAVVILAVSLLVLGGGRMIGARNVKPSPGPRADPGTPGRSVFAGWQREASATGFPSARPASRTGWRIR